MELKQVIDRIGSLQEIITERGLSDEAEVRLKQKLRLEWNFHSTHLEGNQLTIGETEQLMLHDVPIGGKPMDEYKEMQNHFDAVRYVEEQASKNEPLNERFIKELHQILLNDSFVVKAITLEGRPTTKTVRLGEYKSSSNHVTTVTGETFHFASPEETPAMMTEVVDWYNDGRDSYPGITMFIRAALFHYRFIRIHPFDDGNGRMARLLMNYSMLQQDFPPVVIRSDEKDKYLAALKEADAGNEEAFAIYIGQLLIGSLELTLKAAKGESIEEPGDLDKRMSVLETRIDNLGKEEIREEKSETTISHVLDAVFKPLIEMIDGRLDRLKQSFNYSGITWLKENSGKHHKIEDLNFPFINNVDDKGLPRSIYVQMYLKGFKKAGTKHFDVYSEVEVEFDFYKYKIISKRTGELLLDETLYHNIPNKKEIGLMASNILNEVINDFDQRLDNLNKQ